MDYDYCKKQLEIGNSYAPLHWDAINNKYMKAKQDLLEEIKKEEKERKE